MKLVKEGLSNKEDKDLMLEALSDLEHKRWSGWQKHLHSECTKNKDGSLSIPKELVDRWERQISTKYSELTEKEKESDRKEASKTINIINKYN